MGTSLRQFHVELYEEHLEEASFLYDQRHALFLSQEMPWVGLVDFEERLEAHIDALMVGAKLALDVCGRRAVEGDAGELFAAVCVFCRYAEAPLLASILRDLDYSNGERSQAVVDALKCELPNSWRDQCLRAVSQGKGPLVSLLSTVIGYRRMSQSDILLSAIDRVSPAEQRALIWAIGRTRPTNASHAIRAFLQSTDDRLREAALRAGLRVHDPDVRGHLYALANRGQCPPVELGLAGGRSAVSPLVVASRRPDVTPEVVRALGLLGDVSAVRPLIELLGVDSVARAAAEALHVITGAALFSVVQVPDAISEDEMFDSELKAFRETGSVPGRGDGQPFGTRVRQLSADPLEWSAWVQANAGRFMADRRYRLGHLYDPAVLLHCLSSESYPKSWRSLAAEELLVRYDVDLPFEADMPVVRQSRVLRDAAATVTQVSKNVEPGRWYFAGQPL